MLFKFVRYMTPIGVFEAWRKDEEHLEHWKTFYESKGYSSWEEWRTEHANRFKLHNLSWSLNRLERFDSILDLRGGPFRGWKNLYYEGRIMPVFRDIAANPKIAEHSYIRGISENFPKETTITALETANDGVFVIEGMHRCAAAALALREGREIESDITIALAKYPFSDLLNQFSNL